MPSSSLNLSDLNGSNGFVVTNQNNGDYDSSSLTISSAGDINGDGFTDLFVRLDNTYVPDRYGDDYFSSYFSIKATSAYVVFGGLNIGTSGSIDLSTLDGNNGFRLDGTYYSSLDFDDENDLSVITGSDINGDGIADLIISAPGTDPNSTDDAGSISVLFGGTNMGAGGSIDPSTLDGSNGFAINGTNPGDSLGNSVTTASDLNGDGIADLIISAPFAGSIYVVFGGTNIGAGGSIDPSTLDGSNGFAINGTNPGDSLGRSVTAGSDINNDGISDLIISAPFADPNGIRNAGSIYVVFGGTDMGAGGSIDPSTLDGSNGFAINGTNRDDGLGRSTASDINGDGIADLIIGVPAADPNGITNAGSTYVVFGGTNVGAGGSIDSFSLDGSNGLVINGINQNEFFGSSLISNSDLNNDGIADLIIGVPFADPNGIRGAGSTYVVFGGTNMGEDGTLNLSDLDGSNGFVINGFVADEQSGSSIKGLGDINGDGIDDVIIGTPYADPRNISASSYIVFGSPASVAPPTAGNDTLTGTNANDFIRGLGGDDLINGRNGNDTLRGNWGNDTLIGGNGDDRLFGGLGNDLLTGDAGSDIFLLAANSGSDTITDFENGVDSFFLLGGLTFEQLSITQFNDDTLIGVTDTDKLLATLTGVSANLITAANFVT